MGFNAGFSRLAAVVGTSIRYFQFQGGKGVATLFGGMLVLSFPVALIALIVWAVVHRNYSLYFYGFPLLL